MNLPAYREYKASDDPWIGSIPRHWQVVPLKHLADFINGAAFKPSEWGEAGYPIIRIENLNGGAEFNYFSGQPDKRYLVTEGELLFGWSGNRGTSFGPFRWERKELCVLNQHIFRVVSDAVSRDELYWILKAVTTHVEEQAHGIIGMVHITKGNLGAIAVPIPPPDERFTIACFLDAETSKIDALVAEQRRLIELLKEKRQAVIGHAVTKGLDSGVPLKPSGVPWAGDVPAHWEVVKLARITRERCDGPFGSGLKSTHYVSEGIRVIRLSNIRQGFFDGADSAFISSEHYYGELGGGHDVVAGDLLIAGLGDANNTVGRACVAPVGVEPAMVKADCFRFRLDPDRVLPAFAAAQLTVGAPFDAGLMSTGSTRSRMPLSVNSSRTMALPSLAEQLRIVEFIEARSTSFDKLVSEAENAIELLRERRTALISAAVTGKIDVRESAYQESA